MIKSHINLNERTGIMKKKNSSFLELFPKHKEDTALKKKEMPPLKNYAAIASVNRKNYELIREHETLIVSVAVSHLLYTTFSAICYDINPFVSIERLMFMTIPSIIIAFLIVRLVPDMEIVENVDEARKFLLETGQEATYKNINLIVGRYREGRIENNWQKIEDMLYEDRKVPAFENVRNILGDSVAGKLNETVKISYNLKERGNL